MDIVTHAMMGLVLAAPVLPRAPLTGSLLALGCCLPDLDVLSRCFGKCTFLRWHQTYTHSLAFVAGCGMAAWWFLHGSGEPLAAVALAAGLLIHIGLDCCNTFGATALWPLSRRRWSRQWLFFIDAPVTILTVAALLLAFAPKAPGLFSPLEVATVYAAAVMAYIAARAMLASRAWRAVTPAALSLVPSAFLPWRYFGVARQAGGVLTFQLDGWRGRILEEHLVPIFDEQWAEVVEPLREFGAMRALSPLYHVVAVDPSQEGTVLTCRDLRTRNFGGRFGQLQVVVDCAGKVVRSDFHV